VRTDHARRLLRLTEQASEEARPAHLVLVHRGRLGEPRPRRCSCLIAKALCAIRRWSLSCTGTPKIPPARPVVTTTSVCGALRMAEAPAAH